MLPKYDHREFLPTNHEIGDGKWIGPDNIVEYQKNLAANGDWHYAHKQVTYQTNSFGYRCKEFTNVDWNESIVIFGCSLVYGVGLAYDETIGYHLSNLLQMPVVNMGVCASSMIYALQNQLVLTEKYAKPKAVINLWTGLNRLTYFEHDRPALLGPWGNRSGIYKDLMPFYNEWSRSDDNASMYGLIAQKAAKHLWSDTTYYEATFFDWTAAALGCRQFDILDKARDMFHPGPATAHSVASELAKEICKMGNEDKNTIDK